MTILKKIADQINTFRNRAIFFFKELNEENELLLDQIGYEWRLLNFLKKMKKVNLRVTCFACGNKSTFYLRLGGI